MAAAAAAVRALAALLYRRASGLTLAGITVLGQILSYHGPQLLDKRKNTVCLFFVQGTRYLKHDTYETHQHGFSDMKSHLVKPSSIRLPAVVASGLLVLRI